MQLLLGIKCSIHLIQAVFKNLSQDLGPIHNRELDQHRVADTLGSETFNAENTNSKRRNSMKISVDVFLHSFNLTYRDSEIHKNKLAYEFLELYEVIRILARDRFQLKSADSNIVTKAA